MDFEWSFAPLALDDAGPNPYTVSPLSGVVEAGEATEINVRFAPEEMEDFPRTLKCAIPNLDSGYKAPEVVLRGKGSSY
eukprot:7075530-Pyramimonas_sp.AAC.1